MKIKAQKTQLGGLTPSRWLQRAGYALIYDRLSEQESFSRRFSRDFYPRFHLYVQSLADNDYLFFNLHLDHKKASYEGQSRHSADYDGELVEREAERLKSLLGTPVGRVADRDSSSDTDILATLTPTNISRVKEGKKSFWQKIFS